MATGRQVKIGSRVDRRRDADLLFEVVTQRYMKAPIVVTTNRPFSEWPAVFQSATCVGTLLDRLCHRARPPRTPA